MGLTSSSRSDPGSWLQGVVNTIVGKFLTDLVSGVTSAVASFFDSLNFITRTPRELSYEQDYVVKYEGAMRAEEHAVSVFARNLGSLLLPPPLRGRRVLAIDPGFRTGCKLAVLDEQLADHDPASALPCVAICPGDLVCDALAVGAQSNVVNPPKAI